MIVLTVVENSYQKVVVELRVQFFFRLKKNYFFHLPLQKKSFICLRSFGLRSNGKTFALISDIQGVLRNRKWTPLFSKNTSLQVLVERFSCIALLNFLSTLPQILKYYEEYLILKFKESHLEELLRLYAEKIWKIHRKKKLLGTLFEIVL